VPCKESITAPAARESRAGFHTVWFRSIHYGLLIGLLGLPVAALFAASLPVDPAAIGLDDSLATLFAGEGEATVLVMREIRLPREILGAMIGASLGLPAPPFRAICAIRWLSRD